MITLAAFLTTMHFLLSPLIYRFCSTWKQWKGW